jgi:AcrR family transcriptional regulator
MMLHAFRDAARVPMKRAKKADVQPPASARRNAAPGAKGRARIEAILAAARNVLIEKDYKHFSLRGVAAAAGIRPRQSAVLLPSDAGCASPALLDYIVRHYNDAAPEVRRDAARPPLSALRRNDRLSHGETSVTRRRAVSSFSLGAPRIPRQDR